MRKRKHDNKESFGSFFYYTEESQRSPESLSADTSAQSLLSVPVHKLLTINIAAHCSWIKNTLMTPYV